MNRKIINKNRLAHAPRGRMTKRTTKTLRVGCILLLVSFFICTFVLLPQPVQAINTVTATITVGSTPLGVIVTPNGAYAYVTNAGGSVSVISTAMSTVTTASPSPTVPEFPAPLSIIKLFVFMIIVLSVVIIAKKRITWKTHFKG